MNSSTEVGDLWGDSLDLYQVGDVLTPWSNPASHRWEGSTQTFQPTTLGMEVTSYNPLFQRTYLSLRLNNPENLSPSKPQDFRVSVYYTEENSHPKLTWAAAAEPDVNPNGKFRIWRRILTPVYGDPEPWLLHDSIAGTAAQYIDYSVSWAGSGHYTARYKIKAVDTQAKQSVFSDSGEVVYGMPWGKAGRSNAGNIPEEFALSQNYPNPFNPTTMIRYTLPVHAYVALRVYNMLGQEVATPVQTEQEAGWYEVTLDASTLPSGVYLYRLTAGSYVATKKFVVLK